MRAALNILFSCLLLLMQAMAALAPHTTLAETGPCRCCACGNQACPVPQSVPAPTPAPLASERVTGETETVSLPAQTTVKSIAPGSDTFLLPTTLGSRLPAGQPLYRRHCALLI
jgi:hypothetical protein